VLKLRSGGFTQSTCQWAAAQIALVRRIAGYREISAIEKKDLPVDVDAIEQQFRKGEPNQAGLAALVEALTQIASVAVHAR